MAPWPAARSLLWAGSTRTPSLRSLFLPLEEELAVAEEEWRPVAASRVPPHARNASAWIGRRSPPLVEEGQEVVEDPVEGEEKKGSEIWPPTPPEATRTW